MHRKIPFISSGLVQLLKGHLAVMYTKGVVLGGVGRGSCCSSGKVSHE